MSEPTEVLKFLTQSPNRAAVLLALADEAPLDRYDIEERTAN